MTEVRVIDNITKEYPDMIKVISFKNSRIYVRDGSTKRPRDIVDSDYRPQISSLARTKTLIHDLVLCNDFELFCTFTFDPDKVNRFSYLACLATMSKWLHNQKDKSPNFMYLVVPEQHKNGAWHFHALISHYNGTLRDSKHKTGTGRRVYNVTSFRSGFSTAVRIDSRESVANYVTKYITKDFIRYFNHRRFICSQNLKRPIKTYNSDLLKTTPPLFKSLCFDDQDYSIYTISY